ncbi:hypothetical protein BEL04_03965 [Mucilaginibacter sp. PPCGB 2223]|uniref:hypothetical protein n=1 Tax=Mucilaginibacter sp. PPCGB 2223 TaxID=1886027 RepID=UPI000825B25C|nr:hypothetical protein [Mucilaginibacter sp. PPCGB 2223]OCX53467.1 hypothetical protein BEL04_03965 [Mucilaginibacter sp. PPCGB 2223]
MNKTGIYLMIAAVVIILIGRLTFQNLVYVNAVDSNTFTVYINGIKSFPWPDFIGLVMFMSGLVTVIAPPREKGHVYP